MRKAIQFLFISLLVVTFTSCSSDDNSGTSAVLLKKLTYISFGTHAEYDFTYNGTKLTKVSFSVDNQTDGNGYNKYIYTGDLISEIKRYNSNNHNTIKTLFTYNTAGQLIQVVRLELDNDYGYKTIYQYNSDNTVDVSGYYGNIEAQNTASTATQKYYFQNGEIVSKEYSSASSQSSIGFAYDSANHPLKNVTGLKAVRIHDFIADGLFGMEHNKLQQTIYDANGNLEYSIIFEGTYNQDNYPTALYSVDAQENSSYNFQYYK